MTTGANFLVSDGIVQWFEDLISGDDLIKQDHEARAHAMQRTYRLYDEYGNPFAATISSEISKTERDMRLAAEMKECSLQDKRIVGCIVDTDSIVEEGITMTFDYTLIKADGGLIEESFTSE